MPSPEVQFVALPIWAGPEPIENRLCKKPSAYAGGFKQERPFLMSMKGSNRIDNTGRSDSRLKPHSFGKPSGAFIMHPKELLESAAWRALTLSDRKMLDRLEIEHMAHAGKENGRLKCTYDDFSDFGIRRASVPASLARLETLGFIEIMVRGRKAADAYHYPSQYRLTYVHGNLGAPNEWAQVKTTEQAQKRIDKASSCIAVARKRSNKKFP